MPTQCNPRCPEPPSILLRLGTAIIGGLLAIFGAAAGSALTYLLQRKMAVRAEEFAVAERVRAERMAAFSCSQRRYGARRLS